MFLSRDSYAISDITLTQTTSNPCNGNCYTLGYRYVIITNSDTMTSSYQYVAKLGFTYGNNSWSQNIPVGSMIIYSLSSEYYSLTSVNINTSNTTVVISDHIPDSLIPTPEPCPEPEPQEPCEDPEENSQFIKVVIDAFWKYHQVFAGCVAALIAIFVLYRIIKGAFR